MRTKKLGVIAGVLGILAGVIQIVPEATIAQWSPPARIPEWAPLIGTTGQSVVFYSTLAEAIGPLGTLLLAVGFGYYVGRRLDLAREYRRLIVGVGLGSALSIVVTTAAMVQFGAVSFTNPDGGVILILLAMGFSEFVRIALVITVGTFAGAAFAHVRTFDTEPPEATRTGSEPSSSIEHESKADRSDLKSQPTQ